MPENRRGHRGVDELGCGGSVQVERPLAPPDSGHELDRVLGEDGTGRGQRLVQVREVGGQAGGPVLAQRSELPTRMICAPASPPHHRPPPRPASPPRRARLPERSSRATRPKGLEHRRTPLLPVSERPVRARLPGTERDLALAVEVQAPAVRPGEG